MSEETVQKQREKDLLVKCGDGNVLVLTTQDHRLILSRQHGTGVIGEKGPIKDGETYTPSLDDVVLDFKNVESLRVVKDAIDDLHAGFAVSDEIDDLRKICESHKRRYEKAEAENKRLRGFLTEWDGHSTECELYDEGSPRTGYCDCGYEEAKKQALKGGVE